MNKHSTPSYLDNLHIILCRPSHPGNIGQAARAMKTMGISNLIIVAPKLITTPMTPTPPVFNPEYPYDFNLPPEAFTLAAGAEDILEKITVKGSLQEALAPIKLAYAASARRREITTAPLTPRHAAAEIIPAVKTAVPVAVVFGNEKSGLTINEAALCNRLIAIPGNPAYNSLNLAQAVQVLCYEIFSHTENYQPAAPIQLASGEAIAGLLDHWRLTMAALGFFHHRNETRLMRRLGRFIAKADIEQEEIDILRGFLALVQKKLNR